MKWGEYKHTPEGMRLWLRLLREESLFPAFVVCSAVDDGCQDELSEAMAAFDALSNAVESGKWRRVVMAAFVAGQKYERAKLGGDIKRGAKVAERNRRNNDKRTSDAEQRRKKRHANVTSEINRQRQAGERLNYNKAIEYAAKKEGCSIEIVKLNVPNIWTSRTAQNR